MFVSIFLCVSGQEKDGKVVFATEGSTLYYSMIENDNYSLRGISFISLN